MITEDKVTEIFCVADDFCKVFDAQMAKYTFKAVGKRKYHRESRMSKAKKFGNLQIGVTKKAYKQKKRRNLPQNCDI